MPRAPTLAARLRARRDGAAAVGDERELVAQRTGLIAVRELLDELGSGDDPGEGDDVGDRGDELVIAALVVEGAGADEAAAQEPAPAPVVERRPNGGRAYVRLEGIWRPQGPPVAVVDLRRGKVLRNVRTAWIQLLLPHESSIAEKEG